jgi:hypothetical protein
VLAIARGTPPSHRTGPLLADLCTRLLRIIVRIGAKKPLSLAAADLLTDLASEMAGGVTLSDGGDGGDGGEGEGGVEEGGVRGVRMLELDDLLAPRVAAAIGDEESLHRAPDPSLTPKILYHGRRSHAGACTTPRDKPLTHTETL